MKARYHVPHIATDLDARLLVNNRDLPHIDAVNIVDLGLVYDMVVEPLPSGNSKVLVKMTLTAPGCGMGGVIAGDAQQKLFDLPGVEEAQVEIVWDPPWHQSMITPAGRSILGLE